MADGSARIAGTVKIDGVAAARDVIVISDDPSGRQVVGEGVSASDGSFDITYSGWEGPVLALALDNYGQEWRAEENLNNGIVVHPAEPNGYVYQVTSAGTTGTEEPTWATEGSVHDGSVTYEAKPYYRPVASGPLEGEEVDTGPVIPSYRYFRLVILSNHGNAQWSTALAEVALIQEEVRRFPVSSTASSGSAPTTTYDDDPSTTWFPSYAAPFPVVLSYDLGESLAVDELTIINGTSFSGGGGASAASIKDFRLEASNDEQEWTVLIEQTDVATWSASEERTYPVLL